MNVLTSDFLKLTLFYFLVVFRGKGISKVLTDNVSFCYLNSEWQYRFNICNVRFLESNTEMEQLF